MSTILNSGMSLEGPSPSGIVTDPMCPVELTNPCGCNEPCVAVHTAAVATDVPFPCPHVSDHSSSDCQWSTEEHILQRLYEAEGSKLDAAFFYSGMHDAPVLRSPYFYESYEYGFPHSSMAHSPNVDRTFNRHHAKLSSDPTILLTLVRWARIGSSRLAGDDDAVDRLNYQFTTLIILLMITLTGLRQYLSHLPLQCWIPQEFSRSWEEYAEHYCWVTNTYFSDVQARLPPPEERKNVVRYYQWATFVLGLQAAGFFLPCLIWRLLQNYSGFQVKRIMQGVMQVNFATPSTVTRTVRGVAHYMDAIIYQRKYKFWQKLQMKAKVHTYGKASAELSKDSDPMFDPVKTVHFRTHSYDQANDSESTSVIAGSAQSRREGDGLTARKKGPAPSPPVKSSTPCAHSTQRDTIHPEPRSTLDSSGWCSICTCCVNASGLTNGGVDSIELKDTALKKKKKRSLTKKDPTGEERISLETFQPLITGKSGRHPRSTSRKRFGCTWGCMPCETSIKTSKIPVAQDPTEGKTIRVQIGRTPPSRGINICRFLGNALWFSGRLLLTLICLIPGCICHCLRGTQKTKCVQRSNSFLFYLYVTIKLLYLLNIIAQLYFMKLFLDTDSHFFGFYVLRDLIHGRMWTQTGNFPRVTYCDFEAKKTGKNYKYTLQCVLPLNLFLEKVYIFLWFWMIFVAVMTTYSLLKWLSRLSIPQSRHHFVRKFLIPWKLPNGCDELDRQALKLFIDQYLDLNGVFILWLSSTNAGELISGELIAALWDLFRMRLANVQSTGKVGFLGETDFHMDCSNGAFQRYSRDNCGPPKSMASPEQPRLTVLDAKSWKPTHLYMGNAIPPYCTMPKRRIHKPRAPDIPVSRFTSRKLPGPSSSNFQSARYFVNPDLDDYHSMEKCAIDSSLDSIV